MNLIHSALLLLTILLVSCGVQEVVEDPENRVGSKRNISEDEKMDSDEVGISKGICNAFSAKVNYTDRVIVNSKQAAKLNIQIKECGKSEKEISSESATATISRNYNGLQYVSSNSNVISDILSNEHSLFTELCESVLRDTMDENPKRLKKVSNSIYIRYEALKGESKYCDGSLEEPCFVIETLSKIKNENTLYEVRDVTFIRVSIDDDEDEMTGVVLERKYYNNQLCSKEDQSYFKIQTFKGFED